MKETRMLFIRFFFALVLPGLLAPAHALTLKP